MTGDAAVTGSRGALDAHIVVAHADVDARLTVAPGGVLAVMGPSGAGKTTLLEAIAGLTRLDAGQVSIDGVRLADRRRHTAPSRRAIGLLGQDALLFPHMTAVENIAFAARSTGASRAGSVTVAEEWMPRIGLPEHGRHRPEHLSGGQRQRVALARALAARPRLLLLDEPFSSLDVQAAAELRGVVRDQLRGTTTIVVSHTLADAQALADELLILENGRITQRGPLDEVLGSPASAFAEAVAETAAH
ncbi:ATP-binding cassette domain-containing protein [Microbacterium esteraromaticum]|uniref:ATP-binding cassette domain-containing protein n=1 Tax=Microbacterium esteraromaticum TaxID=57043 RepID=UPI0019D3B5E3|nr:ATP-binding cassette domain-containing protein [Microbacterium esteraromaticum]MBN7794400.1 ATP-binding cassette domain-containing protein [Microbacterium esteraromaticum]